MKKKEWMFILLLLVASAALWAGQRFFRRHPAPEIRITVDGEEYGIYSLDRDQTIAIGDTNICEIRDGQVRMVEADCPDQLCIHQGAIDGRGGIIVCLPNRVVIEGRGISDPGQKSGFADAVS